LIGRNESSMTLDRAAPAQSTGIAGGPASRADKGAAALRTHEAVCAERYANLLTLLESTTRRVGRLEVLVVIVAGSVICGMGGIIFTLALKLGTH
jgi:hypothetical protein